MPPPENAFQVLGLPIRFTITRAEIESAYLKAIAAAHPDIANLSFDDHPDPAAKLNIARDTLLNSETRANLVLALLGGPTKQQYKSLPDGFLMDIMEAREQIDEAIATKDPAALTTWRTWALEQRQTYESSLATQFDEIAQSTQNRQALLNQSRATLNAWRYIERMIEQLEPTN